MLNNEKSVGSQKLYVAISGKSGCGNTTVGKLLAKKLQLVFINFTFRNLATERGMPFEQAVQMAQEDENWDREVDRRQIELAMNSKPGCVLSSRLAIWLLKDATLKVYLRAGSETRTARIVRREGGSFDATKAFTDKRDKADHERYLSLYNIDNDSFDFADIIIDVENITPEEITSIIIKKLNGK
jgi:cytidylate kinase